MKTFIAGSPIYIIHVGLGLIPKGPYILSGLFSPFTRGLLSWRSLLNRPRGAADCPQASGSGLSVIRLLGSGSVPSDPCRTYYIGNRGIRKPEKIRKIEKVRSNQPISISSNSKQIFSGELLAKGA
ncbi:MAG: hypothetical protein ABSG67_10625 [Thermoguttaceae bacterium]